MMERGVDEVDFRPKGKEVSRKKKVKEKMRLGFFFYFIKIHF